jgi:hypothetical protein
VITRPPPSKKKVITHGPVLDSNAECLALQRCTSPRESLTEIECVRVVCVCVEGGLKSVAMQSSFHLQVQALQGCCVHSSTRIGAGCDCLLVVAFLQRVAKRSEP